MDILLVSANRETSPYPVFPLGLAYLAGPLKAAGHTLHTVDLCFAQEPEATLANALAATPPHAVIISIRNIDNVTYPGSRSYLAGVRDVVARCRNRAPVVLGGSGFSLMPVALLDYLDGDYGVVGEGELVLPQLLDCLVNGGDPAALPGVVVRGAATFLPPEPVAEIGAPNRSLFQVADYNRLGGMANLQTKRGCPFACIYCTYPLLEGSRMRLRDVAAIIGEIRDLVDNHGTEYLYFVDDIFNYPMDFAAELCREMIAARLPIKWSAFINPGFISPALVETMVAAGCDAMEFGSDSGSEAMLRNLGKSFTAEDIRSASALCRQSGIDFAHYILFGGPGENEATVLESFQLMDEVHATAVIGMTGIRIFPGTALHGRSLAEGLITPDTNLLEPVFYIAPELGDRLCDLVTREALQRTNWVVPGLEINMSDAMLAALRHFPVKGPLWKLMKRLGRSRVKPL